MEGEERRPITALGRIDVFDSVSARLRYWPSAFFVYGETIVGTLHCNLLQRVAFIVTYIRALNYMYKLLIYYLDAFTFTNAEETHRQYIRNIYRKTQGKLLSVTVISLQSIDIRLMQSRRNAL